MLDTTVLNAFSMFESTHVDDACARITKHFGAHQLRADRGHKSFRASMAKINFGGISFASISSTHLSSVRDAMSRSYAVMLCPRGRATVRSESPSGRRVIDAKNGAFLRPHESFEAELSGDCEQLFVLFDEALLRKVGGGEPFFDDVIDLENFRLQPWLDQIRALLSSRQLIEVLQAKNSCAEMMSQLLLELLLLGHPPIEEPSIRRGAIAPVFVRNAEAYMEAHASETVQLAEIAKASGVAERTLHVGFRHFRGYSPMQFLANIRLSRAHTVLSNASVGTEITAVAVDCGFTHLGRFSKAYQTRFGEKPSETLLKRQSSI